jgi:hypothetical protein
MTNKITYAMFAVAVLATVSIGLAPMAAYALPVVASQINPVPNGFAAGPFNIAACGTGACVAHVTTDTIWNNVSATYGTTGNNCQVKSVLTVNGAATLVFAGNVAGVVVVNIPMVVPVGSNVVVTNTYQGCI